MAAVTVRFVVPVTDPEVALIVVGPALKAVDTPVEAILAKFGAEELQLTVVVRFCCVPSLKVPVAVNCCVAPVTMVGLAGLTEIDRRVAEFTVTCVDPLIEPEVAVIVAGPAPTPVT